MVTLKSMREFFELCLLGHDDCIVRIGPYLNMEDDIKVYQPDGRENADLVRG